VPAPPRIYLDTNVFVAAYEAVGARSDHAWWILSAAEAGEFRLVTSELTLSELLVGPLGEGNQELCEVYEDIMTNAEPFAILPVERAVLIDAAKLRAGRVGLKLPDAVHCATALRARCRAMVTDDARMPKGLDLPVIPFGPSALAAIRAMTP
jgi:predicted nucleic acid-binding protein